MVSESTPQVVFKYWCFILIVYDACWNIESWLSEPAFSSICYDGFARFFARPCYPIKMYLSVKVSLKNNWYSTFYVRKKSDLKSNFSSKILRGLLFWAREGRLIERPDFVYNIDSMW